MKENATFNEVPLLPKRLRSLGFVIVIIAGALFAIRFYFDIKPTWLNVNVFAIYSAYIETKIMEFITNQILEEVAAFLLITGLLLLAFTAENKEDEATNKLRLKSFFITGYMMVALYIAELTFLFGFGFMVSMLAAPFIYLIVYNIIFRLMLFRSKKQHF